jgi:hypothetical protein
MNKEEKRILHGLYYHREMIGEEMMFTASEINWLKKTPIPKGRKWKGEDGRLKSIEIPNENYLASISATSAAATRPLAYLQEKGYITYKKEAHYFRIAVTVAGADLARELNTFWGRKNITYKEHKDGVLWFLALGLLSLIVAFLKMCHPYLQTKP